MFSDGEEVGRLRQEVEDRTKQLETLLSGLVAENHELKNAVKSIADENRRLKEQVTTTERAFNATVDKLIACIERLEHERDDLFKPPVKNRLFDTATS